MNDATTLKLASEREGEKKSEKLTSFGMKFDSSNMQMFS